jgi:hypothetical protein
MRKVVRIATIPKTMPSLSLKIFLYCAKIYFRYINIKIKFPTVTIAECEIFSSLSCEGLTTDPVGGANKCGKCRAACCYVSFKENCIQFLVPSAARSEPDFTWRKQGFGKRIITSAIHSFLLIMSL